MSSAQLAKVCSCLQWHSYRYTCRPVYLSRPPPGEDLHLWISAALSTSSPGPATAACGLQIAQVTKVKCAAQPLRCCICVASPKLSEAVINTLSNPAHLSSLVHPIPWAHKPEFAVSKKPAQKQPTAQHPGCYLHAVGPCAALAASCPGPAACTPAPSLVSPLPLVLQAQPRHPLQATG